MSKIMTLKDLDAVEAGAVFAEGIAKNEPGGLYMESAPHLRGKELLWVAKKGYGYNDWCIYCHWAENGKEYVLDYGDKVTSSENIQKLVPCDAEMLSNYRK